ncbi:MAG: hypothetical protein JO100_14200 [Pseudonocardia sp.]|nr:hypothetical protein [Pseudonocardia sp.]
MTDTVRLDAQGAVSGPANVNTARSYRAVSGHTTTADQLGPLADFPGFWEGTGFSIIARPDFDTDNSDGFFLQLNLLRETIEFLTIGSPVIDRGSKQNSIPLFGVTYLHRVTDAITGGALHIETGSWLVIPPTTEPANNDTSIARLSVIPHGNSLCATGFPEYVVPTGPIEIPPSNTVPYPIGGQPPPPGTKNPFRAYDLSLDTPYRTRPVPPGITQAILDDPITLLRDALAGQNVEHITRLIVSTAMGGGVDNIPFIVQNADVTSFDSVFAIERVEGPQGADFMQLQYVQTAPLKFRGMIFPHVTVGTLVKAF